MNKYIRRIEPFYQYSNYIAEYYNTWSNILFVCFGLVRLYFAAEDISCHYSLRYNLDLLSKMETLYIWFIIAGICSAIHHATTPRWTIIIDYFPIIVSILLVVKWQLYWMISLYTWMKIGISFAMLLNDHVWQTIPVPWGHCFWHFLIAISVDCAFQDMIYYS